MAKSDRFEPVIDDEKLKAIGRLTANWAFAELQIDVHLYLLTHPEIGDADIDFDGNYRISFKRRLKAFRDALNHPNTDAETRTIGIQIADEAQTLKRYRDDINHGLWGTSDPDTAKLIGLAANREDWTSRSTPASTKAILDCAEKIAKLNSQLIDLTVVRIHPLPDPQPQSSEPRANPFDIRQNPSTPEGFSGLLRSPPQKDS